MDNYSVFGNSNHQWAVWRCGPVREVAMVKCHINLAIGEVSSCHALKHCPFGDLTKDHYPTYYELNLGLLLVH